MCYEVKCSTCNKSSWGGCGRHVPSVYNKIPEGQHCRCKAWPGVQDQNQVQVQPTAAVEGGDSTGSCTLL